MATFKLGDPAPHFEGQTDLLDAVAAAHAPALGSLCTGAGMLDLAAEAAFGQVRRVWHSEIDAAASAVLAAHYPEVPNLGDLTAVDWSAVKRPDIVTAGFPCTDVSLAGLGLGLTAETRSGVWYAIARALAILRPPLILIENVRGLLSARADCDLEPCPGCVGDLGDKPALRALGAVLGDLSDLGYDAEWVTVPAAEVGAPHRRERVFVAAWPADTARPRLEAWRTGRAGGGVDPADGVALLPTPTASEASGPGRLDGNRNDTLRAQIALLKTPTAQLAANGGSQHPDKRKAGGHGPTLADQVEHLLPTPRASDGTKGGPNQRGSSGDPMLPSAVQPEHWGAYAPAIARWERVLGRRAPKPVEPNRRGDGVRLSARFVEWVMGCDEGWVCDHVGRNDALRILGNGVVQQQAAYAYAHLLGGEV